MDRTILHRFFNGECSEAEKRHIKVWLESDPEAFSELQEERQLFDRLLLNQQDRSAVRRTRMFPMSWIRWGAAACLIGLLGATIYFWQTGQLRHTAWATIKVPYGSRTQIVLPDSSLVWLNAGTTLKYPTDFGIGDRRVVLDGEAYFEVKHLENRRFSVETFCGKVDVLGTVFNVEATENTETFRTALMKGKVDVRMLANRASVILKPGQKVEWQAHKLNVSAIQDYSAYDWPKGIISFQELSMDELTALVKKHYDIDLIVRNDALRSHHYTGKFRISDGLDQLMRILQRYESFTVHKMDSLKTIELM